MSSHPVCPLYPATLSHTYVISSCLSPLPCNIVTHICHLILFVPFILQHCHTHMSSHPVYPLYPATLSHTYVISSCLSPLSCNIVTHICHLILFIPFILQHCHTHMSSHPVCPFTLQHCHTHMSSHPVYPLYPATLSHTYVISSCLSPLSCNIVTHICHLILFIPFILQHCHTHMSSHPVYPLYPATLSHTYVISSCLSPLSCNIVTHICHLILFIPFILQHCHTHMSSHPVYPLYPATLSHTYVISSCLSPLSCNIVTHICHLILFVSFILQHCHTHMSSHPVCPFTLQHCHTHMSSHPVYPLYPATLSHTYVISSCLSPLPCNIVTHICHLILFVSFILQHCHTHMSSHPVYPLYPATLSHTYVISSCLSPLSCNIVTHICHLILFIPFILQHCHTHMSSHPVYPLYPATLSHTYVISSCLSLYPATLSHTEVRQTVSYESLPIWFGISFETKLYVGNAINCNCLYCSHSSVRVTLELD